MLSRLGSLQSLWFISLNLSAIIASPISTSAFASSASSMIPNHATQHIFNSFDGDKNKVPVQLAVMSHCPDAEQCENVWDRVLDQVGSLVSIDLIYIGSVDKEEKYGVHCMHGELECLGNIQQLCAAKYWQGVDGAVNPWADWWNFVQCQNFHGLSKIGSEGLAKECASIVGKKWDERLIECSDSDEGTNLLKESVMTAQKLRLVKSCSIVINGELVCIRDGRWINCEEGHEVGDFVKQVKDAWKKLNQ